MQDKVRVELRKQFDADGPVLFATVNGREFPVVTFSVEPPAEDGQALVSLLIPADSVQVGDPASAAPPQARPSTEKPPVSTWGSDSQDPRANIPGWQPESAKGQVEVQAGDGDRIAAALREHVKRNGGMSNVLGRLV